MNFMKRTKYKKESIISSSQSTRMLPHRRARDGDFANHSRSVLRLSQAGDSAMRHQMSLSIAAKSFMVSNLT
jgi:hypothetical protein